MHNCPICGKKLQWNIDSLNGSVCEEHEKCPNGHYMYDYAYGNTVYTIGESVVGYHYLDNKNNKLKIINELIKIEKERWDA